MPRSVTKSIRRDLKDAANDIRHVLRHAAPRLRDDGRDALAESARRMSGTAGRLTDRGSRRVRAIAVRAMRELRARPLAVAAAVATFAGLIAAAAAMRRRGGRV